MASTRGSLKKRALFRYRRPESCFTGFLALTLRESLPRSRRAAQPKFPALQGRSSARPSAMVLDDVARGCRIAGPTRLE